jgi:hypothetical protein
MKIEDRVLQYLPLLAPVPTAWMVGVATATVLHFPLPIAIVSSLIIEGLGFVAVNTAMQMRDFNQRLSATEKTQKMQVPVAQAYAATALYIVVALAMTVMLHVFPQMVVYAPVPFIIMGVAGAWMYALRADFAAKVQERDTGRAQAKQTRADKKQASKAVAGASTDKQGVQVARKLQVQGRQVARKADKLQVQASKQPVQDEALLVIWRDKPKASDRQVAEQFGTSRQAIQQRREKMVKQGAIRMGNDGVEIIGIQVSMQAEHQS